jgi:hypothetical protein
MDRISRAEEASFGEALAKGGRKLLPIVGVSILYGLAVAGGFILLVIPGIILMLSLILAYGLVIVEDRGVIDSLKRSHALVWGHWWRTAGEATLIGIIYAIPLMLFMAVLGGVLAVAVGPNGVAINVILNIANLLLAAFLTPLLVAGYLAILNDRRVRHDGADLEARLSDAA